MSIRPTSLTPNQAPDEEVLACLEGVIDPEVGLSVVDLGLVYGATRSPGRIEATLTLTSRACPLREVIAADALERLARAFPGAHVTVGFVWTPPWSPSLITDRGLELLGRPAARS